LKFKAKVLTGFNESQILMQMSEARERAEATYQIAADQIAGKMEATLVDMEDMRGRMQVCDPPIKVQKIEPN
jgi:hypothetical protein